MVTIRLINSKTRRKEEFVPIRADDVRMYVCGPTVYDRAHLGNGRPVVIFDVLYRLLRHVYGEGHVTYVRNFTDVDDKINAEALRRQKAGASGTLEELIRERTEETIAWYHADMDALGALRPSIRGVVSDKAEPRATEWIGAMVAMIEDLIAKGHAYEREGHVLFRVRSYKDYGKLSGRSVDDMIAGARVEVAPFKEDPMDFVLWKPSSGDEPGWASPWGKGRPGWHIECSAMSHELLGESFDIHGGGLDLQFPHHENEIAQSACAHPHGRFAQYWLHNEMLQVEGKKMSKSLGNFFTVRDLLDQGIPGEQIRIAFLLSHYRSAMDYSANRRHEAFVKSLTIRRLVSNGLDSFGVVRPGTPSSEVVRYLADDLDTRRALESVVEVAKAGIAALSRDDFRSFLADLDLLGIALQKDDQSEREAFGKLDQLTKQFSSESEEEYAALRKLGRIMDVARQSKNYAKSDSIRSALTAIGIEVQMSEGNAFLVPHPGYRVDELIALAGQYDEQNQ